MFRSHFVLSLVTTTAVLIGCGQSVIEPVDEFVRCRSILGERTAKPVDTWKYDAISTAALQIPIDSDGLPLEQLKRRLQMHPQRLAESIPDFDEVVTLVLLELEVRGHLTRIEPGAETTDATVFIRPVPGDAQSQPT